MATKTKVKTEIIETSSGNFECEVIELGELKSVDKKRFGTRVTEEFYDRVIDKNTVVYVNGERAVVFLKKAIKSILEIKPNTDQYNYWKWVSRDLYSSQRGVVTGIEYNTELGRRYTQGQLDFFKLASKGSVKTLEEARKVVANDPRPTKTFFYINKLELTPYFDMEAISKIEEKIRKKNIDPAEREALVKERDDERLKWFDRWLKNWSKSDDKVKFAAEAHKNFTSSQTYSNNVYSNVLGMLDRGARNPFARWTASTAKRFDDFVSQKHIYQEVSALYRDVMPNEWNYIHNIMKKCNSPEYTLLGTETFSTITVNFNWPTMIHTDGRNNPRGVAVLTAITNEAYDGEKFDGSLFVMLPLRLAFDIRMGDAFVGDNCNLAHAQTEQVNKTDDAENVVCVYYARDGMTKLDTYENECCRRDFVRYSKENFAEKYQKNSGGRFMGIYPGMFWSEEWLAFKNELVADPETGEVKPRCPNASDTSYWYNGKDGGKG